jgi:elongation factor P
MYETSDFKKGLFIEIEGTPYQIVEFQHVKPGKGNAFTRTRVRNLILNTTVEKTFKSGEKVDEPDLEKKRIQYLYADGDQGYQFLDLESYEQLMLDPKAVGDAKSYLIENLEVDLLLFNGKPISLDLPNFVNLQVTYCEPAVRGDTVSGGAKPATLQTGLNINVPYHIKQGDLLKIDTRSGEYVEKVNQK